MDHAGVQVGSVVVGTVKSLKYYGVHVDLGSAEALLYTTQISYEKVSDPANVFAVGDQIKVGRPA